MNREQALKEYTDNEILIREIKAKQVNLRRIILAEIGAPPREPVAKPGRSKRARNVADRIVRILRETGPMRATDVARAAELGGNSIWSAINRLKKRNLVHKLADGRYGLAVHPDRNSPIEVAHR